MTTFTARAEARRAVSSNAVTVDNMESKPVTGVFVRVAGFFIVMTALLRVIGSYNFTSDTFNVRLASSAANIIRSR